MMDHVSGYLAIENELAARRNQKESVKGKDTPFRVEFRYSRGTKHWQYFTCYEDCLTAEDSSCKYSIYGDAVITRPTSKQIQVRGPRGGWTKYTAPRKE